MPAARHPLAVLLRKTGYFLLCLCVVLPVHGTEESELAGIVLGPDGIAIPGATVKLLGPNRVLLAEVRSDEQGGFRLPAVARGRYELRVEAPGFSPLQKIVVLPLDPPRMLEARLQLTPVELQITVTGRHGDPEEAFIEPASVRLRGLEELVQRETSQLPRMLAEETGVLLQETSPGQGSPILRGQGAQSVLYLLDGIRFNNSTYRSGNVQFLGWVPAGAVDSVELFLGPAGTQYGSDALGGAINVMSANLPPWTVSGIAWGGEARTFFNSADLSAGTALRLHAGGPRAALTVGGSGKRHQNLRSGGGEDSHNVVSRFLGFSPGVTESILGSRLRDTAFTHAGWDAKLGLRFGAERFLTFSWLQADQFGIRRYDRLLGGEGHLRSALEPQRLQFGYVRFQHLPGGALRSVQATLSFNRQTDGQLSQTRETSPLTREINRTTSLGYLFSASWRPVRRHALNSGAEFYDEFIFGRRTDRQVGGTLREARPRFPDGTRYKSFGLFLTDDWEAIPQIVLVEAGLRFSHFRFRTRADKNIIGGIPAVPDATETFTDVTFNSGVSYSFTPQLVTFGRIARGFRAPSVFDLGELGLTGGGFEVSPRDAVAISAQIGDAAGSSALSTGQPWRGLKPEVAWSFEGGLRWKGSRVSGDVTFFDSEYFDAIQRRALIVTSPVAGQSIGGEIITAQDAAGRIFVAQDPRPVVSRANIGRVRIYGLESSARVNWTAQWSSAFKGGWQQGRELDTGHFARRIAPPAGFAGLRWSHRRVWLEGFTEVAGPQKRLNPGERDDPRTGALRSAAQIADFFNFGARRLDLIENDRLRLTGETLTEVLDRVLGPARTPQLLFDRTHGFATLNLRGSVILNERNDLSFALLNLTDTNYRRHGSGFDSPGISLSVSYRVRFR